MLEDLSRLLDSAEVPVNGDIDDEPLVAVSARAGRQPPRIGLWLREMGHALSTQRASRLIPQLEDAGCRMLWLPESLGREALSTAATVLGWSERLVVATGIANIWARDAVAAQNGSRTLQEAFPGRFVLGLGISHDRHVTTRGHSYGSPLTTMGDYLDAMDNAPWVGPGDGTPAPRILAALGPKMLGLARDRASGAHTYLVTAEHTAFAREILGSEAFLAPEQGVVLETDGDRARAIGRQHLAPYLELENYRNSFLRQGFAASDFVDGGSDRFVDSLVAWGDAETVSMQVRQHFRSGANHVAVQVLANSTEGILQAFREISPLFASGKT